MIPPIKINLISVRKNGSSFAIIVRRGKNTSRTVSTTMNGEPIPESFYKPYEKKISEKYFREKCLPDIIKYGKMMMEWSRKSSGVRAMTDDDTSKVAFYLTDHVNPDKNVWIKNLSKKTMRTFELLNKLNNGPEIKF
jgi:hypothetical protein